MRIIENLELELKIVKIQDGRIIISDPHLQGDPFEAEPLTGINDKSQEDDVDQETRKKVEIAAVKAVTKHYEGKDWEVDQSPQYKRGLGYDLECTWRNAIIHAEVKGVSGNEEISHISTNEFKALHENPLFIFWVVTSALDDGQRKLHSYTKEEFEKRFVCKPSMYHFEPKNRKSK
ncbi:MAG: DUF3883 domain-containing protein [Anaerolineaceae bacterium]|nr:DUF3883 domain-containing protein [Anaerolineaceae bacterium]